MQTQIDLYKTRLVVSVLLIWLGYTGLTKGGLIIIPVCFFLATCFAFPASYLLIEKHKPNSYYWLASILFLILAALYSRYTILGIAPLIIAAITIAPPVIQALYLKTHIRKYQFIILSLVVSLGSIHPITQSISKNEMDLKAAADLKALQEATEKQQIYKAKRLDTEYAKEKALAASNLDIKEPSVACNAMVNVALLTNGWKNRYDENYGCSSPYKDIGSGLPMPNNLAFYAEGNANAVLQVKLVLNINDKKHTQDAYDELEKAADLLIEKFTGIQINNQIKVAINKNQNISLKLDNTTVLVEKINWPTGGYEIQVIIK